MLLVEDHVIEQNQERQLAEKASIYAAVSRYWPPIGVERVDLYLTAAAGHRLLHMRSARFQSAANEVIHYFWEVQRTVQRLIEAVRKADGWLDAVPPLEDLL
jgi:hypothetical protein